MAPSRSGRDTFIIRQFAICDRSDFENARRAIHGESAAVGAGGDFLDTGDRPTLQKM